MSWENIGPRNIACVIRAIAACPEDSNILYAGAEFGGVWRTINGGRDWIPTMDNELNLNVRSLSLCRRDPQFVYAGMSSGIRGSDNDFYRSEDGGNTWVRKTQVPSTFSNAIAVHPDNQDIIYVAGDVSLHNSIDGGNTWHVHDIIIDGVNRTNSNGIFDGNIDDVKMDPDNPNTIFVAVRNQGLFKTTDGGREWRRLARNVTFNVLDDAGNQQFAMVDGTYRTLLALGEDHRLGKNGTQFIVVKIQGTILISRDGGGTWRVLPGNDHGHDDQNDWCSCVAVCPADQDFVVAGGDHIDFTLNAAAVNPTWNALAPDSLHADQQSIAFTPTIPYDFYFANDGYIGKATRRGSNVTRVSNGIVAMQCFNVAVSQTERLFVGCSTYHCGIIRTGRTLSSIWEAIDCCEGGIFEIDQTNENKMFDQPWGSDNLRRSFDGGRNWDQRQLVDENGRSVYVEVIGIRPHNPRIIYASGMFGHLHYSLDGGDTWDYVQNNDATPLLIDVGVQRDNHALSLAYAPSNENYVYMGTRHGHLWRTTNSGTRGTDWNRLNTPTIADLQGRGIKAIAVHPFNPNIFYIGYEVNNARALWRGFSKQDGTVAWTDISGVSPLASLPPYKINAIIIGPTGGNGDTVILQSIYVATPLGVFVTYNEDYNWQSFNDGLPNADITHMRLRTFSTPTLYVAAWGRGIYKRDLTRHPNIKDKFDIMVENLTYKLVAAENFQSWDLEFRKKIIDMAESIGDIKEYLAAGKAFIQPEERMELTVELREQRKKELDQKLRQQQKQDFIEQTEKELIEQENAWKEGSKKKESV